MKRDELPNTDPDRRLAEVLGARLSADSSEVGELPDAEDARFVELLEKARAERLSRVEAPPSEAMWSAVAARTTTRPAARIYRLADWRIAAAVAAVALVLVTFAVFQFARPEVEMLLESGTERVVYTTADGSTVTLRPHSQLLRGSDDAFEIVGEAYFVVAPQEDQEFAVATGDATVSVLGTQFVVSTWAGKTSVFLEEGRIRLDARGGRASEILAPGDARSVSSDGLIRTVATDSVEALDWLRDEMSFTSQPLGDVISELAHHFDLTIVVPDEDAAIVLSGRILLTSEREALDDLATILDADFVERDGSQTLERRAQ